MTDTAAKQRETERTDGSERGENRDRERCNRERTEATPGGDGSAASTEEVTETEDRAADHSANPDDETAAARGAHRADGTGAEAVVAALEAAETGIAFGVQGGAIMPVYDALSDSSVRHVTMAHEQGAAHAADAYGVVADEPGVCLATSGPGATNLVTGIADADMDSDAMVVLTGQVPTEFIGNDAFQETDTVGVTRPITKHSCFANTADDVGERVSEAFDRSTAGRPGPTLVDLPKDVTQAETTVKRPPAPAADDETPEPGAAPSAIEAAAQAIESAEQPVCLFGGGVIAANASDAARRFARTYEIPVVTTMPGLGSFPEDDPLSLSFAGMHGTGYANMALTHADCLIAVGTRFDDRLTGGVDTFAPDAAVVHVDIDPAEISKNVHADYPLIGDAATVLDQLLAAVDRSPETAAWCEQCAEWTETYPLTYSTQADEPLKPQFVVEAFDEATGGDAIVTTGVGQHQLWAAQFWTHTEPRTWVSSHGLGTMGYGLPAAIGARLAADAAGEPGRDVVCFEGDGSFLMTLQELSVAVRENLDITVVVLNNAHIGMVRQWQDVFYEGRRMASEYDWMPAFDDLAEAFGARGIRIDEYDEVAAGVEEALAADGPAVVDVHIDPEENVLPMVPSGGANGRFALTEEQL